MSVDLGYAGAPTRSGGPQPAHVPPPGVAERRLATVAALTIGVLAVPVAGVAWLLVGPAGALSALIGLGFVLVLFGASAALLALVAARQAGAGGIGILAAGAALRLPLYVGVLAALSEVPWVHGRSLAAATAVAVAVTLATELRMLATTPSLFWVDATAARPSALGNDTRS